jgi:RNA polymerase sigma-70 factor (ECF subfamily)
MIPIADTVKPNIRGDDSILIERVLNGEQECFYELVRPYERSIYVSAFLILRNQADAEEVAQEAVLKAFRRLNQFRGESKFSTWIVQITINEARMRRRKDRRDLYESIEKDTALDETAAYIPRDFADWREVPIEALQRTEFREALMRAILRLPEKYREVFILRDVEHMTAAETAAALGIAEGNVRTRLVRARLMLRDELAPGYDGTWLTEGRWKKVRPW